MCTLSHNSNSNICLEKNQKSFIEPKSKANITTKNSKLKDIYCLDRDFKYVN